MKLKKRKMKMLKVKARGKTLYISGTFMGQRVRQSTGLPIHNKKKADLMRLGIEKDIFDCQMGLSHKFVNENRKWLEAVELYSKHKVDLSDVTRLVVSYLSPLNSYKFVRIRPDLIDDLLSAKVSGSSLNRYRNVANAIINYANKVWGTDVDRVPNPKVDDSRDEHLVKHEVKNLLSVAKLQHMYHYEFRSLIFCGLRLGEMLQLDHSNYDRTSNTLFIHRHTKNTKTNSRAIPIADKELQDFFGSKAKGIMFDKVLSKKLNSILRALLRGIGVSRNVRVHDLRHTFAYLLAQSGADLGDIQLLMGHKDISQTMRYRGWIRSRAEKHISKTLTI